jgi:hypothetical protein
MNSVIGYRNCVTLGIVTVLQEQCYIGTGLVLHESWISVTVGPESQVLGIGP